MSFDFKSLKKVSLYGAGELGKLVCDILFKKGIHFEYLIDRNPKEDSYSGVKILSLSEYGKITRGTIIITIFNRDVDTRTIFNYLNSLNKFEHILTFDQIYPYLANYIVSVPSNSSSKDYSKNYFWLSDRLDLYNERDLSKVCDLLADEDSKKLLKDTYNYRLTHKVGFYPQIEKDGIANQYLGKSIPERINFSNFIDIGAYDGDTIKLIYNKNGKFNKVVAFEPSPSNFYKLASNVSKNTYAEEIYLYPIGTSDKFDFIGISEWGEGSNISVSHNNNQKVPVVTLDDILLGVYPTYIKMDVEGMEKPTIRGAKKLIQKYKPSLAVSAYHLPEDIFEIPILLKSIVPEYNFYFRQYAHNGFDLVLYAVA